MNVVLLRKFYVILEENIKKLEKISDISDFERGRLAAFYFVFRKFKEFM